MLRVKTMFETCDCWVTVDRYVRDMSLAIQLWCDDGPFATLTVCLVDKTLDPGESYVDTNNCPWAMEMIEEFGLGVPTGRTGVSGFCSYPVVKWDMDALMKHTA